MGPSILKRDPSLMADRKGKLLELRFYGEISGVYDSGLTPVSIDPEGHLAGGADGGLEARTDVSVSHQWNHAKLSLEYRGVYSQYANSTSSTAWTSSSIWLTAACSSVTSRWI